MNRSIYIVPINRNMESIVQMNKLSCNYLLTPLSSPELFFRWIQATINKKILSNSDAEFNIKFQIQKLRRAHQSLISMIDKKYKNSKNIYQSSNEYQEIKNLEKSLGSNQKAIEGIHSFLNLNKNPEKFSVKEKVKNSSAKLLDLDSQNKFLTKALEEKRNSSELFNQFKSCSDEKNNFYQEIGLTELEIKLSQLQKQLGQNRTNEGSKFEDFASDLVKQSMVDAIKQKYRMHYGDLPHNVRVVRNLKFNMSSKKGSSSEFDCLVLELNPTSCTYQVSNCRVLAFIEVCVDNMRDSSLLTI